MVGVSLAATGATESVAVRRGQQVSGIGAALLVVVGVALVVGPGLTLRTLGLVAGAALLAGGVVRSGTAARQRDDGARSDGLEGAAGVVLVLPRCSPGTSAPGARPSRR